MIGEGRGTGRSVDVNFGGPRRGLAPSHTHLRLREIRTFAS